MSFIIKNPFKSLFEDDIFISYSRRDAFNYAESLATALKRNGFSCFIDQWEVPRGKHLPNPILRSLRKTNLFVLIGSDGAVASDFVKLELKEFLKTDKPIIPIDVGRALERASWEESPWASIEGVSRTLELKENLDAGEPSQSVIRRIEESYTFNRRNKSVLRGFWIAAITLPLLILANIIGFAFLWVQAARAEVAREEITQLQVRTSAAAKEAQDARAAAETEKENVRKASEYAQKQQEAAKAAGAEAEKQRAAADIAIIESKKQTALADKEAQRAKREQQTAEVQSISRQSLAQGDKKQAVAKALEAVDKSKIMDGTVHSSAEQALRKAIGNTGGLKLAASGDWSGIETGPDALQGVAFSSNNRWMVVGMKGKEGKRLIAFWDMEKRDFGSGISSQPKIFDTGLQDESGTYSMTIDLTFVAVSDDGNWVVSASHSSKTAYAWDLKAVDNKTGTALKPIPMETGSSASRYGAAFSPDGKWVVAGGSLWKMTSSGPVDGKDLKTPWSETHLDDPVAFSADGRWLVTRHSWGSIALWDLHATDVTLHPKKLLDQPREFTERDINLSFSSNSESLVAWGSETGVLLWNLKTEGRELTVLQPSYDKYRDEKHKVVSAASISPDSRWLSAGTLGGEVLLWEIRRPSQPVKLPEYGPHVIKKNNVQNNNIQDDDVEDDDTQNEQVSEKNTGIKYLAFSRDSRMITAGTEDSAAVVWELGTDRTKFEKRAIFSSNDKPVTFCEFSPDGKWLLTYSASLHFWDMSERGSSTSFITLSGDGDELVFARFSKGGDWLITQNEGLNSPPPVRLWQLKVNDLIDFARWYVKSN